MPREIIRDRKYLDWLRDQRCLITGKTTAAHKEPIDPVHIGTAGKGLKASDDEALPISHSIHALMHLHGEMTTLRQLLPDDVLRSALRALAHEMYRNRYFGEIADV